MELYSIVKVLNGENIYLQNAIETHYCAITSVGGAMRYKFHDMVVLFVANITGMRIATVYSRSCAFRRFFIRSFRRLSGTSDKSPR